jgi:hypothetical protein
MNTTSNRRWYQFSLRTMFVLTVVVSIPLAWVGYSLNWIRQRHKAFGGHGYAGIGTDPFKTPYTPAPAFLWVFGENGVSMIWCRRHVWFKDHTAENLQELQRLFPEAEIILWD